MKYFIKEVLPGIGLIILVLAIVGGIYFGTKETEITDHQFTHGDMVRAKIDGRKGMIVRVLTYQYTYYVRFSCREQRTNTRLLGTDGTIDNSPYACVRMFEYELMPADDIKGEQ